MDQPLVGLSLRGPEATTDVPSRGLVLSHGFLWSVSGTGAIQLLRLFHRAPCARNHRILRKPNHTSHTNAPTNPDHKQGASAVLCFGAIESPLAQPRALIFGHFFSALIGVCITKLFSLMPDQARFESLRWLAASLSTALAIVAMQLTGTTHPPAGATALLPATNDEVWHLSWYYLPVVLLSSTLLMCCALLLNNLQRRYPVFWVAPDPPAKLAPPPPAPAPVASADGNGHVSSHEKLPKESA